MIHILLHFLVPASIALIFFRKNARSAFLIMIATMLVDLDHLLATPIYDPDRCSIGFHPLHSLPAIGLYLLMIVPKRSRLAGIGLLIHMALDQLDCMI